MKRPVARAAPNSVRQWNEYVVVSALRDHGPQRISELGETTGLTPAPLGQVLRSLQAKGWVAVGEPSRNGLGRPAQVFNLCRPAGSVLGLDVGAHAVRAVRVDLGGTVIARAAMRLPQGPTEEQRRAAVRDVVEECLGRGETEEVWLTTLAVGGHLSPDGGIVRSVAVPEWDGRHPLDILSGLLPSRGFVVNDVRSATWAEHAVGAAQAYGEVLVAQLGRRPTIGLLFGGIPRRGAHGTAGDMSLNALLPTEDEMGWLEPFAQSPDPIGDGVRAALAGDEAAIAGACAYVETIAPALAFAASVVDPAVFVVAGALSPLAEHFIGPLKGHLDQHLQQPPVVLTSPLDEFSTALGAALMAVEQVQVALASPSQGVAPFTKQEFDGLSLTERSLLRAVSS